MQYCSLEGNYFPSTVLNFSSGLAGLTYKKLGLGRKREARTRGTIETRVSLMYLFELSLITLFTALLGQQHYRPVPAPVGSRNSPPSAHLTSHGCCADLQHPVQPGPGAGAEHRQRRPALAAPSPVPHGCSCCPVSPCNPEGQTPRVGCWTGGCRGQACRVKRE